GADAGIVVDRNEKIRRMHQVGSDAQEDFPFPETLPHQADVPLAQVAQPAVDQFTGFAGGAGGDAPLLDQRHRVAGGGRRLGDPGAVNAAANHGDVDAAHALASGGERVWRSLRNSSPLNAKPRQGAGRRCRGPVTVPTLGSELREDLLGGGFLHAGAVRLDIEGGDHAVVDDHGVALGAGTHAEAGGVELKANGLGELAGAVGEQEQVLCILGLAPGAHHEGVVDGDAGHGVDALGLDLVHVHHVAGHVGVGTTGGEGARHSEQDYPLALENVIDGDGLRAFAGHGAQGDVGEGIAHFDGHGYLRWGFVLWFWTGPTIPERPVALNAGAAFTGPCGPGPGSCRRCRKSPPYPPPGRTAPAPAPGRPPRRPPVWGRWRRGPPRRGSSPGRRTETPGAWPPPGG